ncbi:MAG: preprotein translocase subunit SecE, partial [Candidatus Dormiibacterota bacterium]
PGGSGAGGSGAGGRGRRRWGAYLRGVLEELRKVIWPNWSELRRMTAVVVATVIVFALLIGGADFAFTAMTSPLITPTNASTNPTTPASGSATPAASPSPSAGASPSARASASATVSPSATPTS